MDKYRLLIETQGFFIRGVVEIPGKFAEGNPEIKISLGTGNRRWEVGERTHGV